MKVYGAFPGLKGLKVGLFEIQWLGYSHGGMLAVSADLSLEDDHYHLFGKLSLCLLGFRGQIRCWIHRPRETQDVD